MISIGKEWRETVLEVVGLLRSRKRPSPHPPPLSLSLSLSSPLVSHDTFPPDKKGKIWNWERLAKGTYRCFLL